jgi:ATP-binding cassette subfamily C (CFTR/MRP) protein 4
MFESLIRTPVRYFDENPSGRILNRFTSDAGVMDLTMNYVLLDAIEGSVYLFNLLIFIIIMNYWISIPAVFILAGMVIWIYYNKIVIMESKRLDMIHKSPIFSFYT